MPTPTPARQCASEPIIGAVTLGGALARGCGRGRRRKPTRGRGQTPGPARNREVTPPPTNEVVREDEEGPNEQVQDKEVPPQPTSDMINKVLTYLSRLSDQGLTPPVFSRTEPQVQGVQHATVVAPLMDGSLEGHVFFIYYLDYNDR